MNRLLPSLALTCLLVAGCGKESTEAPAAPAQSNPSPVGEPSPAAGAPAPPADATAAGKARASVEGAWVVDRVERAGKEDPELAKGKLLLELKADGTFVQTMDVATIAGTWALRGSTLTLVTKSVNGEEMAPDTSAEEQTDSLALKDGRLVMSDGDVRFLLRRR